MLESLDKDTVPSVSTFWYKIVQMSLATFSWKFCSNRGSQHSLVFCQLCMVYSRVVFYSSVFKYPQLPPAGTWLNWGPGEQFLFCPMRLFFELVWAAEIFDSGCGSQLGTLGTHAKLLIWGAATILQSFGISLGLVPVEI